MDREYYVELSKIRLNRAKELLEDARELFDKESYKSANNRAFYAIEKSIKALLATKEIEVATHNGGLKQFNYTFIYKGTGDFTAEDYQKVAQAEQIRNVSDYDDFYIASREEAKQQIDNAECFIRKADSYLEKHFHANGE